MNAQAVEALTVASAIKHGPEAGRARENAIREFLRPLIADAFGLSTGFVIDAAGKTSQQQDIVIFRRDYHPIFVVSGIQYFMAEAVVAVIQCRSSTASRGSLVSAIDNIVSVKHLDRTNGGKNYVVLGGQRGPLVDPERHHNQIFGAIVTESSLSNPDDVLAAWHHHLSNEPVRNWPNAYIDVHRLTLHYMGVNEDAAMFDPNAAEYLTWSEAASPPLVVLAQQLMGFLRVVPIIDFHSEAYLPQARYGQGRSMHIRLADPRHAARAAGPETPPEGQINDQ